MCKWSVCLFVCFDAAFESSSSRVDSFQLDLEAARYVGVGVVLVPHSTCFDLHSAGTFEFVLIELEA